MKVKTGTLIIKNKNVVVRSLITNTATAIVKTTSTDTTAMAMFFISSLFIGLIIALELKNPIAGDARRLGLHPCRIYEDSSDHSL
jgi:hypothetical protein